MTKIFKGGIYKNVPDKEVAAYEAQGFCRVDKGGKPIARSADAKALNKQLTAANARIEELEGQLTEANTKAEQMTALLAEANARIEELSKE